MAKDSMTMRACNKQPQNRTSLDTMPRYLNQLFLATVHILLAVVSESFAMPSRVAAKVVVYG
ncbi:MAG: hypothetical protein AUK52_08325 [Comamonadaceae bacterium CG2_30_60_41]|nr:MAG: hypothetical protein AUK52_08325 [Comamonadaceae bacterium CG2_30_60_41]